MSDRSLCQLQKQTYSRLMNKYGQKIGADRARQWLADKMQMPIEDCDTRRFTQEQCEEAQLLLAGGRMNFSNLHVNHHNEIVIGMDDDGDDVVIGVLGETAGVGDRSVVRDPAHLRQFARELQAAFSKDKS